MTQLSLFSGSAMLMPAAAPAKTISPRSAADGLAELLALGYTVEHSWEIEVNDTYNLDLPDGTVTTMANAITPNGEAWLVVWDPFVGNFFCDDEILKGG